VSQHDPYAPTGPVPTPAPPLYPQSGEPAYGQGYPPPAYGQGYGQPAYPPAGSPPPGYGYGYDTGPPRTNLMAILGLVFAFVFSPLGIVFSAVGLSQIKTTREKGRGLAVAGLVLSIAFLVLGVLLVVMLFVVSAGTAVDELSSADRLASSAAADPSDVATDTGGADAGAGTGGAAAGDAHGVLGACQTIIPTLLSLEADLQDVHTPEQYAAAMSKLESTLSAAAATTTDATFTQQVAQLNDDLEKASAAVQKGEDPSSLESALDADGQAIGSTCGSAGFTD
jgi:hypothetical protein